MKKLITILFVLAAIFGSAQSIIVGAISIVNPYVCATNVPSFLTSTPPNGTLPTYQWQSSLNNSTFNNINGATADTYQSGYLDATTYIRQQQNATGVTGGPLPTNTITLYPVSPMGLVSLLENQTITTNQCYNAIRTMTVQGGASYFRVQINANVTMASGYMVSLLPGAKFDSGSYVHAFIRSLLKSVNQTQQASMLKVNGVSKDAILRTNSVNNY